MKTAYYLKFLTPELKGPIATSSLYRYPRAGWTRTIKNLVPCESGYHVIKLRDIPRWAHGWCNLAYNNNLWLVEVDTSGMIESRDKSVVRKLRLVRQLYTGGEFLDDTVGWRWNRHVAEKWCKLWGIKLK